MKAPTVSVVIPNYNNRPFLEARLNSVRRQTFQDWELVVVDFNSEDGAYEVFQHYARSEPRMRLTSAPRLTIYDNWNHAIRLAVGRYIYIATSDDTMHPECLAHMVAGLDAHQDCDLCHCLLDIIDESGAVVAGAYEATAVYRYFGEWMQRCHIRKAPHDAILHSGLQSIYVSVTQLLIRRRLFDAIGMFRADLGAQADFAWAMRASATANTLHIPERLATWRRHGGQATRGKRNTAEHFCRLEQIVASVLSQVCDDNPALLGQLDCTVLRRPYAVRRRVARVAEINTVMSKMLNLLACIVLAPGQCVSLFNDVVMRKRQSMTDLFYIPYMRRLVRRFGCEHHVTPTRVD